MTAIDDYIGSVLRNMPAATPDRSAIATELRSHIAERVAHGQPLAEVLRQLGDPARLAESYLSAVPLTSAPLGRRAIAKIVDASIAVVVMGSIALVVGRAVDWSLPSIFPFVIFAALVGGSFAFATYTVVAEHTSGQTVGKRLLEIRVVSESGARIGLGQAVVRQLPLVLQVFWIDAMFALFTERNQRAFELLSKTRTVRVSARPFP